MESRSAPGSVLSRGWRSDEAAYVKAEMLKSIQQSQSKMWNDYLLKLSSGEVGWAEFFSHTSPGVTMDALTDKQGKQVNTLAITETILREQSIPLIDRDQYYTLPPARTTHKWRTEY